MNYPFWDVDIGYGLMVAIIAVPHVFVSHFAIGGGLYLVISEHLARKRNDLARLDYLQVLSKFFVLVTLVFGAITGVGIWFIIGLLSPAGTEVLIHHYVWGWATEWTFFIVEITAAILYYYGWKKMSAKNHMTLGWIYFGAAWMSLFVINGIIAFMLTPGEWLTTGNFWDGFFNPTFWPALVMRTGICIMLAGLFSLLVASRLKTADVKVRTVRYNAVWGLVGLAVTLPAFWWYWYAIPFEVTETAKEMMAVPMTSIDASYWLAAGIAVFLVLFGLLIPRSQHTVIALVTMALGLAWFGSFEWFRESVRKPYIITDYMYGNGVELAKADDYREDGYLKHMTFRTGDDGADLFRRSCRSCHQLSGYQPLKPAYDGTDAEFIAGTIRGAHVMRGNMPEFYGTDEEIDMLAAYLDSKIDHRHLGEIYGLSGVALGKKIYDVRCGKCHVMGGYNDKSESILGLTEEDYNDLLDMAGDLAEEMPPFTGDDAEREALIEYLQSLGEGGPQ
jgi:mono/diheme cytochrome c family protein